MAVATSVSSDPDLSADDGLRFCTRVRTVTMDHGAGAR